MQFRQFRQCPCGTKKDYSDCCEVFILNKKNAATPEELMRSRYSAYTQADMSYIERTMKSPAADNFNAVEAEIWSKQNHWIRLEIVNTSLKEQMGYVEFLAHYYLNSKHHVLHENSEFKFEERQWFYVNGHTPLKKLPQQTIEKIPRNSICLCGSNKKFKRCCGVLL